MKRYNENFPSKLKGFDFTTLESSKHSIYGLSKELNLIYFNPGFVHFAKENNHDGEILNKFPLGTPITEAFSGKKIKEFYIQNYKKVLATGELWHHEFECSSRDEYRQFHQGVYPMKNGDGLIIINTLMVNLPMDCIDRKAYEAIEKRYVKPTGFITQCSNCRYTQRIDQPEIWDWIPVWVVKIPGNMSHSICPTCFDYYWKYSRIKYTLPHKN